MPGNVGDMTTTRIDHTGHDHVNTPAARAACRAMMAKNPTPTVDVGSADVAAGRMAAARDARERRHVAKANRNRAKLGMDLIPAGMRERNVYDPATGGMTVELEPIPTTVAAAHCQACGNVADTDCGVWDGYTSCCNERVVGGDGRPCGDDCYHA